MIIRWKTTHFYTAISFLSIQLLNELSSPFYLTYLPKFFLISFLQFFFIKRSNNFFTFKITNNICPRNSILNFWNQKNIFRPIWNAWYSFMITNFTFMTPFLLSPSLKSIYIYIYIYTYIYIYIYILIYIIRFHFDCAMICIVAFIHYII